MEWAPTIMSPLGDTAARSALSPACGATGGSASTSAPWSASPSAATSPLAERSPSCGVVLAELEALELEAASRQQTSALLAQRIEEAIAFKPEWRARLSVLTSSPLLRKKILECRPRGWRECGGHACVGGFTCESELRHAACQGRGYVDRGGMAPAQFAAQTEYEHRRFAQNDPSRAPYKRLNSSATGGGMFLPPQIGQPDDDGAHLPPKRCASQDRDALGCCRRSPHGRLIRRELDCTDQFSRQTHLRCKARAPCVAVAAESLSHAPTIRRSPLYSFGGAQRFPSDPRNPSPGPGQYCEPLHPIAVPLKIDSVTHFGAQHPLPWKGLLDPRPSISRLRSAPMWSFSNSVRPTEHGAQAGVVTTGATKTDLGQLSPGPVYRHYGSFTAKKEARGAW